MEQDEIARLYEKYSLENYQRLCEERRRVMQYYGITRAPWWRRWIYKVLGI